MMMCLKISSYISSGEMSLKGKNRNGGKQKN